MCIFSSFHPQPRNDGEVGDATLDGCLTIQSLQCNSGHSSTSSKSTLGTKSKHKLKPVQLNKPHSDKTMASITIQHHPHQPVTHYTQKLPPPLVPCTTMTDAHPPSYYPASSFPSHNMHLAPPSPAMLPSPIIPSPEQCSPLQISPSEHPQSQVCPQAHQVSPKMAQLSPGSGAYPNYQPPTSCIYSSNPASPMQVAYSPGQPHARITSTNNLYQHCNGMDSNISMSVPLQYIPPHPPPDYTEAVSLNGTHFMPSDYPLAIASEYPQHHTPALPGIDPPHSAQYHQ